MDIDTLNKTLKYIMIGLLILVVILTIYYKYDDCTVCKFEYENDTLEGGELLYKYSEKCFKPKPIFNSSLLVP